MSSQIKYCNLLTKSLLNFLLPLIIFTSCDKEISVSGPQEYEIGSTKYFISSNPPGARIFYDDKFTGKITPDTIDWISEGEHSFTLNLYPFFDYTFVEEISADTLLHKEYDFYSNPLNYGSIKFVSTPDRCNIYINDVLMYFKAPHILSDVKPGMYKITYKYPEHRDASNYIFVTPQKQYYVHIVLEDTTNWITYNTNNSDIVDNTITDIYEDAENTLWIGTGHNGIMKLKQESIEIINKNNSNLVSDIIHKIKPDREGNIWVGTYHGISKISGENIISYSDANSGLTNNYIRDFDFDNDGTIWIGTEDGLCSFDGTSWRVYNTENSSIPENFITAVLIDAYNNLWIGTNEFSTHMYEGISGVKRWTTFQVGENLKGDAVSDLIIGPDNTLWVGLITELRSTNALVNPGGIFRLEDGFLVEKAFPLSNKSVHSFYMDYGSLLWIATRSGALSVNAHHNSRLYNSVNSGLPVDDILSVCKDSKGNIWFGTNGAGLTKQKNSSL